MPRSRVEAELRQRGQADAAKAIVARFAGVFREQAGREAHADVEVDVAAQHQLNLLRVALAAVLPGIVAHGDDDAVPGIEVVGFAAQDAVEAEIAHLAIVALVVGVARRRLAGAHHELVHGALVDEVALVVHGAHVHRQVLAAVEVAALVDGVGTEAENDVRNRLVIQHRAVELVDGVRAVAVVHLHEIERVGPLGLLHAQGKIGGRTAIKYPDALAHAAQRHLHAKNHHLLGARRRVGGNDVGPVEVVAALEQRLAFEAHVHGFAGVHGGAGRPVAAPVQHAKRGDARPGRDVEIGDVLGHVAILDVEVAVGLAVGVVHAQLAQHPVVGQVAAGKQLGDERAAGLLLALDAVGAAQVEVVAIVQNQLAARGAAGLVVGDVLAVGVEEAQATGPHHEVEAQRRQLVAEAAGPVEVGPLGLGAHDDRVRPQRVGHQVQKQAVFLARQLVVDVLALGPLVADAHVGQVIRAQLQHLFFANKQLGAGEARVERGAGEGQQAHDLLGPRGLPGRVGGRREGQPHERRPREVAKVQHPPVLAARPRDERVLQHKLGRGQQARRPTPRPAGHEAQLGHLVVVVVVEVEPGLAGHGQHLLAEAVAHRVESEREATQQRRSGGRALGAGRCQAAQPQHQTHQHASPTYYFHGHKGPAGPGLG